MMKSLRDEPRTWPPPSGPWLMHQTWSELLFAHWTFPPELIRPLVPASLELQTFEGKAYIGIVPFRMSNVRPRWLPPVPWLSFFPELNVRTYVTVGGKPGVFFFSLDAANPVAVRIARAGFHLPYKDAKMSCEEKSDGWIHYNSRRSDAELIARYRPTGPAYEAAPGTLDDWLTARYALYAVNRTGQVFRGEIHHVPWPLQTAEAIFEKNTMLAALNLTLPDEAPLLHFARRLDVIIWLLTRT